MSQSHDLYLSLLRPAIIHTLRAAGFHSTKPSVLETLTNLAERHLLLLASTTLAHATNSHNDSVPTITDVRMALTDAGVLVPYDGAEEEDWRERMRQPLKEIRKPEHGGESRARAEERRRDERDVRDVREFMRWFDGPVNAEIQRVAGLVPDSQAVTVGVGGGKVHVDDFVQNLKRKWGKVGEETRFAGTVIGNVGEEKVVVIEGGPVGNLNEWRPALQQDAMAKRIRVDDLSIAGVEAPADGTLDDASDDALVESENLAVDSKP